MQILGGPFCSTACCPVGLAFIQDPGAGSSIACLRLELHLAFVVRTRLQSNFHLNTPASLCRWLLDRDTECRKLSVICWIKHGGRIRSGDMIGLSVGEVGGFSTSSSIWVRTYFICRATTIGRCCIWYSANLSCNLDALLKEPGRATQAKRAVMGSATRNALTL
jgi:hypothetical protein